MSEATGGRRDDDTLEAGLGRFFSAHPELVPGLDLPGTVATSPRQTSPRPTRRGPAIRSLVHAEGGMANETVLVDLGPGHPGVAVRLPPVAPTFPDYRLAPQALVQTVVAAAGVPAPAPAVAVDDISWIGSPFLVMPRVRGDVAGPAPLFDPFVADAVPAAQRRMHDELVDTVVAVHAVRWEATGLDAVLPGTRLQDAFDEWDAYIGWASEGDPLPALAKAMEWCGQHLPAEREPVLLWGDVRLGNLVFDPGRRVVAVLDWDLARLGPREMDLGWHVGLDHMMETLFGRRVPGFPGTAESVERYERLSGYEVRDLGWHEIFALVRALAIQDRHQRIRRERRRPDNPMANVLLARLEAVAG
jgi:aminoglycoside phosphotransferase (APT) family kinase protein